jgi:cardiolipin synthase
VRIFDLGGGGTPRDVQERYVTVPNMVTFLRLCAVPFIVTALLGARFTQAFVLLVVFASTDWIDGYLARTLDQVSRFGALFDPAVDRVFIIATALALLASGLVPLWAVLLVVLRDAGVLVLAGVLLARGVTAPPVSKLGKAGSFAVMAAALLIVAAQSVDGAFATALTYGATATFVLGVVGAYLATAGYARALWPSVH